MINPSLRVTVTMLLCLLWLAGCTGGPRPDKPLGETSQVHYTTEKAPPLDDSIRLGPGDVVNATFLTQGMPEGTTYKVQAGDTLLLEFHGAEHLNRNLIVRPDGMITIPYLGDVKASGKEPIGLGNEICHKLKAKGLFPELVITLSVVGANTVYKRLQEAVTTSESGHSKDVVIASDGTLRLPIIKPIKVTGRTLGDVSQEVASRYQERFPASAVLITLKQIDSLMVYVMGEVNSPGLVRLRNQTTVTQVLAQAGGYKDSAGLSSVIVLRANDENQPEARIVNVADVLSQGDLGKDLMLRRYDVVYVPPSLVHSLNQAILFGIRRMLPIDTMGSVSAGFSYVYQRQSTSISGQ